jgi:hypothetical protein
VSEKFRRKRRKSTARASVQSKSSWTFQTGREVLCTSVTRRRAPNAFAQRIFPCFLAVSWAWYACFYFRLLCFFFGIFGSLNKKSTFAIISFSGGARYSRYGYNEWFVLLAFLEHRVAKQSRLTFFMARGGNWVTCIDMRRASHVRGDDEDE